jgi:MFS family permease
MQISPEKNNLQKFLVIDGLFEGGRMFVGATSITYLMSVGISLQEIAALKSIQAFVLIFGEIPTGVLADSFGRKLSLILGGICAIVGFLIYYFSHSFFFFGIAETLTALSLCFWSGAFESCAIDTAKLEHSEGSLNKFFHLNNSVNSVSVMFFGFLGGYLGMKGINLPYLGAVACYIFMLLILYTLPHEIGHESIAHLTWFSKIKTHMVAMFKEGILHPVLLPFFLTNIAIQFLIQPLLHYWQPFFQAVDPSVTSKQQGLIFSGYCGAIAVFSYFYSLFSKQEFARRPSTIAVLFSLFSILYFSLSYADKLLSSVIIFVLLQVLLSLCRTSLSIKMNEVIDSKSRASILSALSLISRLGMIGALALIARMVTVGDSKTIIELYRNFGALSFILIVLLMIGMFFSKRKKLQKV